MQACQNKCNKLVPPMIREGIGVLKLIKILVENGTFFLQKLMKVDPLKHKKAIFATQVQVAFYR